MLNKYQFDDQYSFTMEKDGVTYKCDTLGIVERENNDTVLIYTDYTLDLNMNFNYYAASIQNDENGYHLVPIPHPELIPEVNEELNKIKTENNL